MTHFWWNPSREFNCNFVQLQLKQTATSKISDILIYTQINKNVEIALGDSFCLSPFFFHPFSMEHTQKFLQSLFKTPKEKHNNLKKCTVKNPRFLIRFTEAYASDGDYSCKKLCSWHLVRSIIWQDRARLGEKRRHKHICCPHARFDSKRR